MSRFKNVPITRSNKFFSREDFDLEINFGREFVEHDGNFNVVLYRVDRNLTTYDDLYTEASVDGIRFLPPIELKVFPTINKSENKSYNNNGSLRYLEDGNLIFDIYQKQLDELNVELNFGDYIGYQVDEKNMRYYSVTDDGLKNYFTSQTIMGYKSAVRQINCAIVDLDEFKGL
jgi:hypothetical protein